MYMPGRLRTGSRPSRTWMSSPVYYDAEAISVHSLAALGVREGLERHGLRRRDQRALLHDLVSLASARRDLLRIRLLREVLAALLGLELEHVALAAGDERDDHVGSGDLDHGDAAAGAFELRDLVGLAVEDVTVARRGDDDIAVVARHDAEHFVAILRLRVAPARLRRDLGVLRHREAEAEALLRHGEQRLGHERARLERHRRDDLLAIGELEVLLRRIAVTGRRGDVVDLDDVRRAAVREEDDLLAGRAGQHVGDDVALARARRRRILELADALQPAVAGDDDVRVLLADERIRVELLLAADDGEQRVGGLEDLLDPLRLGRLLVELLADDVDLELREPIQLELEDRIGLDLVELEPLDDLLGGVVLALAGTDDLDDLVERVEDRDEAFEDVY